VSCPTLPSGQNQPTKLMSSANKPRKISAIHPAMSAANKSNDSIQYLKIVFVAETSKIIPATTRAVPASKLTPELESFIATHTKTPIVIDAADINSSRACARMIKVRGGFDGIGLVPPTLGFNYILVI
jgi:hypothetical protein